MTNKPGTIDFPSKIGVFWNSEPWPIRDAQNMARETQALGYGSLFVPEGNGKDAVIESAAVLGATRARMLTALYPGRFVLGLGVALQGSY